MSNIHNKSFKFHLLFISLISFIIIIILFQTNLLYTNIRSIYQKLKIGVIRKNEESENTIDNSTFDLYLKKVCKKASSDLQKYYETYDTSLMDISGMSFDNYDYYPEYIEALLNIIEKKGTIKDNLMIYLKHAIPSFMFIILGILSIVGWLFFYFFCCCNCCCCCCCKKEECKCTFLFVPLVFDFAIIITCIAGIFSSGIMFTGLADVECSFMKFISEINNGEKKQDDLRWIGFEEIIKILDKIKNKIDEIKVITENELNTNYVSLGEKKTNFPEIISLTYKEMLDPNDPDSPLIFDEKYLTHVMREDTLDQLDVGVLDVLYEYGPMKTDEKFLYKLNEQYETMTGLADEYLKKAHESFEKILEDNSVNELIESSKEQVEEINTSINKIKDEIAKYIIDYSDPIESYGKYVVKIIYIVIISLAGFSGFSVVMMYTTAEECCYGKCCCGKGFTKMLAHISWNLMSLVMICSFMICGVVFLLSYLGEDLVQVITIIFGQKNLYSKRPILIKGNVGNYFNVCFHGDGDLGFLFGLTSNNESSTYQFDELNKIIDDISEIREKMEQEDVVIKAFKEKLENRKKYTDINIYDFNTTTFMNLDNLIYTFNDLIKNNEFDVWTLNETCPDENYLLIHCPPNINDIERKNVGEETEEPILKECLNFKEWKDGFEKRYQSPIVLILDETYTTVLKAARYFVKVVNNITDYIDEGEALPTLIEKFTISENAYNEVIKLELDTLDIYNKTIYDLVSVFNELNNGEGSFFSFLNCKFIEKNALIIVKNLKGTFSKNVKIIGVTMVLASFGMLFSIIFTILEVIILKFSLYLQKRRKEKEEQITLALGNQTKVMTFAETEKNDKVKGFKNRKKAKINNFETTS